MKKLMLSLLLMLSTIVGAVAQTPRQILDQTAQKLERAGAARAEFHLQAYEAGRLQNESRGNIDIKGQKIHLTTPEMGVWYDGTTQWSLLTANNEVNIQEPSDEELAMMNPYAFIALYREGYNYRMKREQYDGVETYEVTLTARRRSAEIKTIIINIHPTTMTPMRIRLQQDVAWVHINISNLRLGVTINDSEFVFPRASFPNVTVVDLR